MPSPPPPTLLKRLREKIHNLRTRKATDGGYRHVLKIAIPLVLSNAAFTIMQFTDRALLARYSTDAIQAALPAGILTFTLTGFFAAIAGYSGTFVSQYFGANDDENAAKSFVSGIYMSFFFLPIFIAMIPLCHHLMQLFGHPPTLLKNEMAYSFWMMLTGTPLCLQWVISGYLVGRNHVKVCTIVSIISCITNIALDITLIFGHFGLPALGIKGAAIATFSSQILSNTLLFLFVFLDPKVRSLNWRKISKLDLHLLKKITHYGIPSGFGLLTDAGSFAFFTMIIGRLDALSLATSNIIFSINSLAISPLMGFGNAAAVLSGQFQGAQKSHLAKRSGYHCLHLGWLYTIIIATIFLLFPSELISIFKSPDSPFTTQDLLQLGRKLLLFATIWQMFDTMTVILSGALRGAGDTHFVMFTQIILNWCVWIPSEIIIIMYLKRTIVDAWLAMLFFIITFASTFATRFIRGKWMQINLIRKAKI